MPGRSFRYAGSLANEIIGRGGSQRTHLISRFDRPALQAPGNLQQLFTYEEAINKEGDTDRKWYYAGDPEMAEDLGRSRFTLPLEIIPCIKTLRKTVIAIPTEPVITPPLIS